MSAVLTAEQALKLVGEMFVYHMPFNRALGMELERYEKEFAQLAFKNQPMMVGNWAQSILHGGVIASALDVAAGLVCVGSTLTRHETISEDELRQRYRGWGPLIFASIICAQAEASVLLLPVACYVQAIKSPSPALNYTMKNSFILPVLQPPIW
ncbi:thioesterase family protein [Escherichia coli]|uniref:Thioesterase family protein n=1 Tax=Escherichia coli TaxID=562 RepID=A0A377DCA8_ECOLX|nr:thioesterase family protein [Escherichia coli]